MVITYSGSLKGRHCKIHLVTIKFFSFEQQSKNAWFLRCAKGRNCSNNRVPSHFHIKLQLHGIQTWHVLAIGTSQEDELTRAYGRNGIIITLHI
jgi:hypothetical protein